jgi:2-desacetyl-2-hydroxyethyl bacteriochlorophyllide A dehydrogenase
MQVLGVHTEGGMREFFSVPASKLLASKSLTVDQLALVETLGIGAHAVARADIERGEWALVIGAGPIGLGVMQFAKQAGARVIALDVKQNRLEFCQSELKVDKIVQAGDDVLERVRELTGGDLPTVVFDATGYPPSMEAAFDYIAPGGRLVFVGLVSSDLKFHDPHFHRREITLLASRNATNSDLKRVVALMETGEIDTTPWITHRAALGDVCETFPQWLQEEWIIKAVIEV